MELPVPLYIPNLLGYTRILLAFVGLNLSETNPGATVLIWILSASLDLFDGILARRLNQCSSLGVLIDIAADNILRTTVWISVATQSSYRLLAGFIISLEWITMVCTQLHAGLSGKHWKLQREHDPWLIRQIFANNFRTPLGCLAIYGLFAANMFAYGANHDAIVRNVPFFHFWKNVAFCGRGLAMFTELWLCKGYLSFVVSRDLESKTGTKRNDFG